MFKNISLKLKISLFTGFILFITGFIATIGVYLNTLHILTDKEQQLVKSKSQIFEITISEMFTHAQLHIEKLSFSNELILFLEDSKDIDDKSILALLDASNYQDDFSSIYILDSKGIMAFTNNNTSFIGQDFSFRPYFQHSINGKPYIYMAIGVSDNLPSYYISYPIVNNDGGVIGVVVGKFSTVRIQSYIDSIQNDVSINIVLKLVDEYGVIMQSGVPDENFYSLSPLTILEQTAIKEEKRYADIDITSLDFINNFQQYKKDYIGQVVSGNTIVLEDSDEKLIYIDQIKDTPFCLLIETDIATVVYETHSIAGFMSLQVVAGILVSIILINIFIIRMLRPLEDLSDIADQIANGNFNLHAEETRKDEIGRLSHSFNKMKSKLLKLKEEETVKVNVKTKILEEKLDQLQKMNKAMIGRELKMLELKQKISNFEEKNKK